MGVSFANVVCKCEGSMNAFTRNKMYEMIVIVVDECFFYIMPCA